MSLPLLVHMTVTPCQYPISNGLFHLIKKKNKIDISELLFSFGLKKKEREYRGDNTLMCLKFASVK